MGPDHSKTFEVRIEFSGKRLAAGRGSSKREAEQDAARNAFVKLGLLDIVPPKKKRKRKLKGRDKRSQASNVKEGRKEATK